MPAPTMHASNNTNNPVVIFLPFLYFNINDGCLAARSGYPLKHSFYLSLIPVLTILYLNYYLSFTY